MTAAFLVPVLVVVVAAAIRSTWSPCGWSMLSTITPISERARGHRFGATATWFTAGAVVGGTVLGTVGAAAAAAVRELEPSSSTRFLAAAIAALAGAGLDAASVDRARFPGALPHHRRQVNEHWLDEFRPWVYAGGFGAQIGAGLATYIMTTGVYLVLVLGALTASPWSALVCGVVFGTVRGAAVWTGRGNGTPERLAAFHRRFAAATEPVRVATAGVLASSSVAFTLAGVDGVGDSVPVVLTLASAIGAFVFVVLSSRPAQPGASTVTPERAPLMAATSDVRRINEPTTA